MHWIDALIAINVRTVRRITAAMTLTAVIFFVATCITAAAESTPLLKALRSASYGAVLNAEALAPHAVQAICVLEPYQDRIVDSNEFAVRVNRFLRDTAYEADEGHFAFIFIGIEKITVERVKRSAALDTPGGAELHFAEMKLLPHNFHPKKCVAGSSSAVVKIRDGHRAYAVFGSVGL